MNVVSRRLPLQSGVIDIEPALECSWVTTLNGRPYPIQFRSQGAIDAWTRALGDTEVWRRWQDPGTLCWQIRQEVLSQLERVQSLSRYLGRWPKWLLMISAGWRLRSVQT